MGNDTHMPVSVRVTAERERGAGILLGNPPLPASAGAKRINLDKRAGVVGGGGCCPHDPHPSPSGWWHGNTRFSPRFRRLGVCLCVCLQGGGWVVMCAKGC
eukprot:TRINITY_DN2504_c0_g2_i1.p2 TRINITY_DN2504_c0_g2~~TRINITY_DN2504_c0_g2_i1.p2  ORF type:complete len:101 (-),score=2.83 TRINITY_DN2504_c0_g2_i1:6-308(-)